MADLFCIYLDNFDLEKGNLITKNTVLDYFETTKKLNLFPEVFQLIDQTLWIEKFYWFHLGIYKNKIIAFGEDGLFYPFCYSVQDIPLQILTYQSVNYDYNNKLNNKINIKEINDNSLFSDKKIILILFFNI